MTSQITTWEFQRDCMATICVELRRILVAREGFDPVDIDRERLVISKDFVDGLHQLLLLSSHICFLFSQNQDHQSIFVLGHWDAAVAHSLESNQLFPSLTEMK